MVNKQTGKITFIMLQNLQNTFIEPKTGPLPSLNLLMVFNLMIIFI